MFSIYGAFAFLFFSSLEHLNRMRDAVFACFVFLSVSCARKINCDLAAHSVLRGKPGLGINLQNRLIKEGPLEEMVKKGRVQKNSPKCADAIDTVYTRGEYLYLFFS